MTDLFPRQIWRPPDLVQLAYLQKERPARALLAGGTLVVPEWQEVGAPEEVIYLPAIPPLRERNEVWCGAALTLAEIASEPAYPRALRQAAESIAGPAIRNIATVGGNLASTGDRCLAVALLSLNAWVDHLEPLSSSITRTSLQAILEKPVATIIRIGWDVPPRSRSCFVKFGVRATSGLNLATVAIHCQASIDGPTCAIAVGSTGSTPHRLPVAEAAWKASVKHSKRAAVAAGQAAMATVQVQESDLVSADYRREIVGVLIERSLWGLIKEDNW